MGCACVSSNALNTRCRSGLSLTSGIESGILCCAGDGLALILRALRATVKLPEHLLGLHDLYLDCHLRAPFKLLSYKSHHVEDDNLQFAGQLDDIPEEKLDGFSCWPYENWSISCPQHTHIYVSLSCRPGSLL